MSALEEKLRRALSTIRERGEDGVWIARFPDDVLFARAAEVEHSGLPLAGVTVAVKDNIDVAGLPTTAGCPEFSYHPPANAFVVQRLLDAGAIVLGKTNLDQFATGLNGTRTPHPIPRNAVDPRFISGGSSSGSAVAVALGEVDVALGTDTAGSGRVPAAFHHLIGFKPTRGRWSTSGLVPACRSLDCITVFARTLNEALAVDRIVAGYDAADPFSRPLATRRPAAAGRVGVLAEDRREFFGDQDYAALYAAAVARARDLGWEIEEFDDRPFLEAAALLYQGPWVAERFVALRDFLARHAEAVHPVVRAIVMGGENFSAADAFTAQYQLAELIRRTAPVWDRCEMFLLPTAGTIFTVDDMLANPIEANSRLGRYTNFVNLMDLAALAIPAGARRDGIPFGVTLVGPAWTESNLARRAAEFLGEEIPASPNGVSVAVVGAHLRGQPLNRQLVELGAEFVTQTRTASNYRLFALPGTQPPKPGLIRGEPGAGIEVEIWSLDHEAFGRFVAAIPAPLGIGTVTLADGRTVKGFLCEPSALDGAEEITACGGWRAYLAERGVR